MEKYFYVQVSISLKLQEEIDSEAISDWGCTGIEDFSIDESTVDSILGERSYSGGDIPDEQIFEVEETVQTDNSLKKYYFDSADPAKAFLTFLKSRQIDGAHLIEKEVRDWNEEWKKNFSSIEISRNLRIVPEWDKGGDSVRDGDLFIYPGMGFGTGSHETTFLCLKIFEQLDKEHIASCMDFGCGSGILGLAVYLKNRTPNICLYDIDPNALENTRQNIRLNNFSEDSFDILLPKQYPSVLGRKFDLVFANILQQTLLLEQKNILGHLKPHSTLILSGLLAGQEKEVIDSYQKAMPLLDLIGVESKGDWVAVHMELRL